MSRACFQQALDETLGRPATPEEKFKFDMALARLLGGERVYVAHRRMNEADATAEIVRLRLAGYSLRRIAKAVDCSKSHVADVLSKFSPYGLDTQAA